MVYKVNEVNFDAFGVRIVYRTEYLRQKLKSGIYFAWIICGANSDTLCDKFHGLKTAILQNEVK